MHDLFRDIEDFIFLADAPQPSDIIFIPGNGHAEPSERAAELYCAGYAPLVLPSGRWGAAQTRFEGQKPGLHTYAGAFDTEWAFMRTVLLQNGVPETAILREDQARFTYQNAIGSRFETERLGLTVRRALLCCMPVHARRAYLYYQVLFPEAEIRVCPSEARLNRDTWRQTPKGIDKVLGELARCGNQFSDILKEKALQDHAFPSPLEARFAPGQEAKP